jgi:hypothetical protein
MAVDRIPVHANRAREDIDRPLTTSRGVGSPCCVRNVSGPGVPVRRFTLEVGRQIVGRAGRTSRLGPDVVPARAAFPAILDRGQLDGAG